MAPRRARSLRVYMQARWRLLDGKTSLTRVADASERAGVVMR